ncbi:unnamed protein product [Pleuronectes platessa]|uniref:Uncharacterized protein n=1 Tax=Pleuronectes platessa TaxID=8262 RepID=A0A9N7UQP8_PLEPL|nr:unnamed protein product [Pleuronectes platessa]
MTVTGCFFGGDWSSPGVSVPDISIIIIIITIIIITSRGCIITPHRMLSKENPRGVCYSCVSMMPEDYGPSQHYGPIPDHHGPVSVLHAPLRMPGGGYTTLADATWLRPGSDVGAEK